MASFATSVAPNGDFMTFESMGFMIPTPLQQALKHMGYYFMTPVQEKVLKALPDSNGEFLVQARTGTGKTTAFLLPVLKDILLRVGGKHVQALILAPTRELAMQIKAECDQLTAFMDRPVECHIAVGGQAKASMLKSFMGGSPTILVATPGRLNDYLSEQTVRDRFANLHHVILDEADRMLDQGFIDDIKKILTKLPSKKSGWKGMCFSATLPPKVKDVLPYILAPNYTSISTIAVNDVPTIDTVPQYSVVFPTISATFASLLAVLAHEIKLNPSNFKAIVFGTTAYGVAMLYEVFHRGLNKALPIELDCFQLHSRLSQPVRTRTTEAFKEAHSGLMFASDVVGRGLDFPLVSVVIQLGLPSDADQYIHRVGRTARAGHDGRAVILLAQNESFFLAVNKHLPIEKYPYDLPLHSDHLEATTSQALDMVSPDVKNKAYRAFLGFYKSYTKKMRLDNTQLVLMANEFAVTMRCPEQPSLEKKTVGKMGLKGVPGLLIAPAQPQSGSGANRGGQQQQQIPAAASNGNGPPAQQGAPRQTNKARRGGRGRGNGSGQVPKDSSGAAPPAAAGAGAGRGRVRKRDATK